jgi:predicted nucleotidyltransferase
MITQTQIAAAVDRLAQAAQPERILLFGSHACGEAREESDLDLLVIETHVPDRAAEMVRLRRLLRPLRIPVDLLVYSRADVERWGNQPGSALFWALREGKVIYG